jgi:hypothetical protein
LSGLRTREEEDAEKEVADDIQDYNGKGVLFQPHHSRRVLREGAPKQERGKAAASDTSGGSDRSRHNGTQGPCGFTQHEQQTTDPSVRAPNDNKEFLGFWTLSIVRCLKGHDVSETDPVSETSCSFKPDGG